MQNEQNNYEQDPFSRMFRQKLENHQVPSDHAGWEKIVNRMKSGKRRIIPFWFWISGGAAVAGFALLFMLRPITETSVTLGKARVNAIGQMPDKTTQIAKYQQHINIQLNKAPSVKGKDINRTNVMVAEVNHGLNAPMTQNTSTETTDSIDTAKNTQYENTGNDQKIAENSTIQKDTISETFRSAPNSLVETSLKAPVSGNKTKNGWLLAASFSSHGGVPTGNDKYNLATGNRNKVSFAGTHLQSISANDFSNIIYTPPVSVGVVIRKNLSKNIGLESGLVYTYILTTFENSVVQQNDAKLHLHYIGVPLNVIARLWNRPRWEVYVSGGGMLEKGLSSFYVVNQHAGNQTITTTATTNIDGVQWSVNGAVGTTYKLQRHFGIFFEPKISYFFDNHQPISARTNYPVVIGLTAGVRFQFK